ncbi:hypothetical protein MSATCC14277_3630 [Metamycoplasma salivarium]|uniref:YlxR family protein n=1 Tax=Metamycoplasma salivarium TaxID=2124 RepID=UPI001F39562E|nr:YlxR family protein [Metamycoplasma salivarium]GIZ05781.1 hypothetical protein MSATCC14277_3630 [Metamycoplasma salivarium]
MKTENKIISRKSIVDGQIYPISELIRFAKSKNGEVHFDPESNLKGKGAYCLNNISQLDILFKRKLLNKTFRQNIDIEMYNTIKSEVDEWIKSKIKENQI